MSNCTFFVRFSFVEHRLQKNDVLPLYKIYISRYISISTHYFINFTNNVQTLKDFEYYSWQDKFLIRNVTVLCEFKVTFKLTDKDMNKNDLAKRSFLSLIIFVALRSDDQTIMLHEN